MMILLVNYGSMIDEIYLMKLVRAIWCRFLSPGYLDSKIFYRYLSTTGPKVCRGHEVDLINFLTVFFYKHLNNGFCDSSFII